MKNFTGEAMFFSAEGAVFSENKKSGHLDLLCPTFPQLVQRLSCGFLLARYGF